MIPKEIPQKEPDVELIVIDEKSNFLDSLGKLLFFLNQTEKNKISWKWAILSLYEALYEAMILALQGTNPERVLELCRTCKKTRSEKLITFEEAFKWIKKKERMQMYVGSKIFIPNKKHNYAVDSLSKDFRNNFVHFIPRSWFIDVKEFPGMFKSCLEVIQFCLFESNNVIFLESERNIYSDILVKIDECLRIIK